MKTSVIFAILSTVKFVHGIKEKYYHQLYDSHISIHILFNEDEIILFHYFFMFLCR